jgi:hypothetical protein
MHGDCDKKDSFTKIPNPTNLCSRRNEVTERISNIIQRQNELLGPAHDGAGREHVQKHVVYGEYRDGVKSSQERTSSRHKTK